MRRRSFIVLVDAERAYGPFRTRAYAEAIATRLKGRVLPLVELEKHGAALVPDERK
jgi:hypothetical protein